MEEVNSMTGTSRTSYFKSEGKKNHQDKDAVPFLELLHKQLRKGDQNAVLNYNNYIQSLLCIHKECAETPIPEKFPASAEPKLPVRQSLNQDIAEQELSSYAPTVLDKVLGQSKKKISNLMKNTEQAKRYDDLIYNAALREFRNDHQKWIRIQRITGGIREGNTAAFDEAIEFFEPFLPLIRLGAELRCESFTEHIIAHLYLHTLGMIPDYLVSQAASGKVLKTKMPESRFNEICHHHVCACALKIGRELFNLLPVRDVYVNAYVHIPENKHGGAKDKVVLSVKFTRDELLQINFSQHTPPEHIANFEHQMEFSVITGFSGVRTLFS